MSSYKKKSNSASFSKEYSLFALITIFICAAAMLILVCADTHTNTENNKINLEKEGKNIASFISESFDYTNEINVHLGHKIANNGAQDLNYIVKIFKESDKIKCEAANLFSWTSFDWVNSNNYETVNRIIGVRKNPPNMSSRQYTKTAAKNPWTLQVSPPALGIPSKSWIIPAGTGVMSKNNRYLGIVSIGFNIEEFTTKVSQRISKDASFIVLDKDMNIIMQSRDNKLNRDDDFFKKRLNAESFTGNSGFFKENIEVNEIQYSYYTKLDKYPYIVITGFNKSFLNKEFSKLVLPCIIGFIGLTLFFLLMLYLFKSRIMDLLLTERKLKKHLESTNESKTNLIRATSHDLRNYILGISGVCNMILENKKPKQIDTDQDLQLIKIIREQSEELFHFVEDLLDTNQIESGEFILRNITDIDINQVIHRIISLTKNASIEYKVFIKTDLDDDLPKIRGDFRRMKQVFSNLVNNALKYSNRDTTVKITTQYLKKEKEVLIEIVDQGIGMNKEEIEMALKGAGENIDKSGLNKKIDSHGIGLPIVKKLIELHEGRLEIESEKGVGTTIKLYFKELPKNTKKITKLEKSSYDCGNRKTVLLAEDNKVNSKITVSILKSANCNVFTAENGKKAVEIFKNENIDLILMDIEMPIMNGYEAAAIIRKENKEVPIIALTSHSDKKSIHEARDSGINRVLDKSSGKKELLDLVFYFFER